ncbi:MAG: MoaD/ThiS family protein [Acidilobaceae archaeon]|nr:MoaD/ThiS family protein [Acidilobaceae archaeon]MCX8165998.1 MoaD/ThiS family protein [Acidilobaceae archaeon]MDW7974639.1 MoaD/ThiS family protein [Sulfolobales archaeon]
MERGGMRVSVKVLGRLTELLPERELSVSVTEGETLEGLLRSLDERAKGRLLKQLLDEEGRVREEYVLLLNGAPVTSELKEVKLRDGDRLVIFPPASGGAEERLAHYF